MALGNQLTDDDKSRLTIKAEQLEGRARELHEERQYGRAGLLYGWAGNAHGQMDAWEDAAYDYGQSGESYKRDGDWSRAGLSYSVSGEAYERAGKWLGAGLNYSLSGYAYGQGGDSEKAAESYRRAGEAYEETGKWREVAVSYQHSGEACRNAHAWRAAGLSFAHSGSAFKKAGIWVSAEENFRNAKMAYVEAGAYDDSGRMYYEEMVMKRMRIEKRSFKRLSSYLHDLTCGYGEKPRNVLICWVVMILFFGLIYLLPGGLAYNGTLEASSGRLATAFNALYFSTVTFATLGHTGFEPHGFMRPVVMAEALLGISMIVLFVLVLGRKMMRR